MWNTYKRITSRITRLNEDDRTAIEFVMRVALLIVVIAAIVGIVVTKLIARGTFLSHLM